MHWYICPYRITERFTDLIKNLLGSRITLDNDIERFKWYVQAFDRARFDIYCPNVVVRVCAGRIGQLDGKLAKNYELELMSRRDFNGLIDYTDFSCYLFKANDYNVLHAEASDFSFWNCHSDLEEMQKLGIHEVVRQFCYVMEKEK